MSGVYEAETRGVLVRVDPVYLPEQSNPDEGQYAWCYTVDIVNCGTGTFQLLSRHWIITDAANRVEEVIGPGVVGEQPVLRPGESFRYTSGCPLKTSSGVMRGTYRIEEDGGETFDAVIPAFSLHLPDALRRVN